MHRIAIFASGTGSNADNLSHYFSGHPLYKIALIVSDKEHAGVFKVAEKHHIPAVYIDKENRNADSLLKLLNEYHIELILLAGYLRLIPSEVIAAYPGRILNIHPALLPAFGGKGMYGMNVHQAVVSSGVRETGITIHVANDKYDEGNILKQCKVEVTESDSPQQIAAKVHDLEMQYYPEVAEAYFTSLFSTDQKS